MFATLVATATVVLMAQSTPVPIQIYTPQMRNDMKNVIDATADLEKGLLPHFERLKRQKEDYDATCGSGATDEACQDKFSQMTATYDDLLTALEDGLAVMVDSIQSASSSYNTQFNKVAQLRPSDVFDEIAGTNRSRLTPDRRSTARSKRQLAERIRILYRLIGEPGVSQAEQFIHSAADLSETAELTETLLATVRYHRLSLQANLLPAEFEKQYEGLMPGVAALILGEEAALPPPTEYAAVDEVDDWSDRLID